MNQVLGKLLFASAVVLSVCQSAKLRKYLDLLLNFREIFLDENSLLIWL